MIIKKEDLVKRSQFILNIIQSHDGATMHGALTSKSDSMGGIFDRFINTISEDIFFNKMLINEINNYGKIISFIIDNYLYKPSKNGAGIAPDVFGIKINNNDIPFVKFNEKWIPVENMPQVEVKTFKAKDQMVSLRNQDYDGQTLVLLDLQLRIDYLVPLLDSSLFTPELLESLKMNDEAFIENDSKNRISKIKAVDFSETDIGNLELIAVTNASDFMSQATECGGRISVRRMKDIVERTKKTNIRKNLMLSSYANQSPRINSLYEFNNAWYQLTNIDSSRVKYVDFSCDGLEHIEILDYCNASITITANAEGCSFNKKPLEKGKQYMLHFDTLERTDNNGTEYFMQKQCASHLRSLKNELIKQIEQIIKSN